MSKVLIAFIISVTVHALCETETEQFHEDQWTLVESGSSVNRQHAAGASSREPTVTIIKVLFPGPLNEDERSYVAHVGRNIKRLGGKIVIPVQRLSEFDEDPFSEETPADISFHFVTSMRPSVISIGYTAQKERIRKTLAREFGVPNSHVETLGDLFHVRGCKGCWSKHAGLKPQIHDHTGQLTMGKLKKEVKHLAQVEMKVLQTQKAQLMKRLRQQELLFANNQIRIEAQKKHTHEEKKLIEELKNTEDDNTRHCKTICSMMPDNTSCQYRPCNTCLNDCKLPFAKCWEKKCPKVCPVVCAKQLCNAECEATGSHGIDWYNVWLGDRDSEEGEKLLELQERSVILEKKHEKLRQYGRELSKLEARVLREEKVLALAGKVLRMQTTIADEQITRVDDKKKTIEVDQQGLRMMWK